MDTASISSGVNAITVLSTSSDPITTASPYPSHSGSGNNQQRTTTPNTRFQYLSCLSCSGGGFAYGTVIGWSSPAASKWYATGAVYGGTDFNCTTSYPPSDALLFSSKAFLTPNEFYLDPDQFSWAVTVFALGAALTAIPAGLMLQYLGRKIVMYIFLLPMLLGWMLLMFATTFQAVFIGRLFLGIGCGTSSVIVPIYNAEVSVPEIRGRTGAMYQFMVNTGILFMFVLGPFVNLPTLVFISAIVTLVFYAFYYFAPESPTFLISRGLEDEAVESLRKLRGDNYNTEPEMVRLRKQQDEADSSICVALMRPNTLRGLAITSGLMVFFQMSGINALIYFTTSIFQAADSNLSSAVETIITGIMQLLGSTVTLLIVDRSGRRVLLLASAVTAAFSTLIIGVFFEAKARDSESTMAYSWLPLVSMCAFFLIFSMGFSTISWIILGEVFDVDIKGFASSLAVSLHFALSFAVTKGAFRISASLGVGGMFWMFSGFSVAGIVFIIIVVPETKNKTFQQIQRILTLYNYA